MSNEKTTIGHAPPGLMKTIETAPGVLYPDEEIVLVCDADLSRIKDLAEVNARQRARLCTHSSASDAQHEMFIVLQQKTYVRPHKHVGKTESFTVLEGSADLVLFHDDGRVRQVVTIGASYTGRCFYCRLSTPIYHTFVIRSPQLVFHEVTAGPFRREQTIFAEWAPEETNTELVGMYRKKLQSEVDSFLEKNERERDSTQLF